MEQKKEKRKYVKRIKSKIYHTLVVKRAPGGFGIFSSGVLVDKREHLFDALVYAFGFIKNTPPGTLRVLPVRIIFEGERIEHISDLFSDEALTTQVRCHVSGSDRAAEGYGYAEDAL